MTPYQPDQTFVQVWAQLPEPDQGRVPELWLSQQVSWSVAEGLPPGFVSGREEDVTRSRPFVFGAGDVPELPQPVKAVKSVSNIQLRLCDLLVNESMCV